MCVINLAKVALDSAVAAVVKAEIVKGEAKDNVSACHHLSQLHTMNYTVSQKRAPVLFFNNP